MTPYVIDASVAARFLLVEDLSDKAELVLEGYVNGTIDLAAPRLMAYEVGNTLWKAFKRGAISAQAAKEKTAQFMGLKINFLELNNDDYEEIMEWSAKNDASYYDGTYVVASKKVKGVLLTADDVLYEKAGRAVPTMHLRDFIKK
jgi:predicted nucleic acid-binding protein